MDSSIPKDDDILLGVRQERSLKFSLVDITTELGRQLISWGFINHNCKQSGGGIGNNDVNGR